MSETQSRSNPLVAIAAIAVIIFSVVGVGVMTGYIPSSKSTPAAPEAVATPPAAPAQPATVQTAPVQPAQPQLKVAKQPAPERRVARTPAAAPAQPAYDQRPAQPLARPYDPAYDAPRVATAPPARPAICTNCGSVEAINISEQQGAGSGLGAIAGGVAGALLGNQVGRGTGRKVATVAGAAGGAYAGHQVEKHVKSSKSYEVVVRMEDGGSRRFPYESQPAFRVGDRVKVVEGALVAN